VFKLDCIEGQENLLYSDKTSGNLYNYQWTHPKRTST